MVTGSLVARSVRSLVYRSAANAAMADGCFISSSGSSVFRRLPNDPLEALLCDVMLSASDSRGMGTHGLELSTPVVSNMDVVLTMAASALAIDGGDSGFIPGLGLVFIAVDDEQPILPSECLNHTFGAMNDISDANCAQQSVHKCCMHALDSRLLHTDATVSQTRGGC